MTAVSRYWKTALVVAGIAAALAYLATRSAPSASSAADTFALANSDDAALSALTGGADASDLSGEPAGAPGGFPRFVRAEAVIKVKDGDGYTTAKIDHGVIDAVNGSTIVLKEEDGTSVEIPTSADTRFGRDGKKASLSDLQVGDHALTFRVKGGDAFVTKGVRAMSQERFDQMEQHRGQFMERHPRIARRKGERQQPAA